MCSAAFYYPAERIYQASKDALLRKGFKILKEDQDGGYLKAKTRFSFFKKPYLVEVNIVSDDAISTLNLQSVNDSKGATEQRQRFEYESKLIDTVYKLIRARDMN